MIRPPARFIALLCCLWQPIVLADQALIAVATNFAEPLNYLQPRFEAETGHELRITTGATGKLYAQIVAGAPFDMLLAADQLRPARLEADGLVVPGSRFTYAVGRIVLWSADPARVGSDGAGVLRSGDFRRLAIANPELAPYGVAARQTLEALDLWACLQDRLVMGENIGQAYAMVATGNAELGIIAAAQLSAPGRTTSGSYWEVPGSLHEPIRQDAVLLVRAADNKAAKALVDFLQRADTRAELESFGYGVEPATTTGTEKP